MCSFLHRYRVDKLHFTMFQLIVRVLERGFQENMRAQKSAEQKIVELLKVVHEIELDRVLEAAQKLP